MWSDLCHVFMHHVFLQMRFPPLCHHYYHKYFAFQECISLRVTRVAILLKKKKPLLIWKMQIYVSLHDLSSIHAATSTGRLLTGEAHPYSFGLEEQEDPAREFKPLGVSYLTWWNPWLQGDSMSRCFGTWLCLPAVHGWLGPRTLCWEIWHLTPNCLPRPDKGLLLRIIC